MYTPTLTLTHKMVHHIVKLEGSVKDIKDTLLPTLTQRELLLRMAGENLHGVGKLAGLEIPFKEAEKISRGKTLISPGTPEMVLSNFRSTSDFIYSSSNDKYISLSASLLLHLNKLLTKGLVDEWDTGRFKNVSDDVIDKYDCWCGNQKREVQNVDFQQHFTEVLNWFQETRFLIHPIIKIGCVIYELFQTYPFVSGNQLTIVATVELLFEKSRHSLGGLFPVSRNFVLYEEEYLEAMKLSAEKNDDVTVWIERFIRGISLDLVSLKNEVVMLEEEKMKKKKNKLLDLNSRQLKLVRYLRHKPKIYRREYVKMMGVSTMTAYRDINELVKRKIIEIRGGGRSTYYILVEADSRKSADMEKEPLRKNKIVKVITDFPDSKVPGSTVQNLNSGSVNSINDGFTGFAGNE